VAVYTDQEYKVVPKILIFGTKIMSNMRFTLALPKGCEVSEFLIFSTIQPSQ